MWIAQDNQNHIHKTLLIFYKSIKCIYLEKICWATALTSQ